MLFLADEAHRNCAKAKLTRRHPPMGRRVLYRLSKEKQRL